MININNKQLRNERKFVFFESLESIEKLLKFIGAKEIYSLRDVNSIYFDTYFHKNYYEAIDGVGLRNKIRVRWYGNTFNTRIEPHIENKIKTNYHNFKITKKMNAFKTGNFFSIINFKKYIQSEKFDNSEINFYLNNLYPNLFVSYFRKYFVLDNVRITLDTELKFINIAKVNFFSKKNFLSMNKKQILELKYSDEFSSQAGKITKTFNNRLNKFSKYQIGLLETFY